MFQTTNQFLFFKTSKHGVPQRGSGFPAFCMVSVVGSTKVESYLATATLHLRRIGCRSQPIQKHSMDLWIIYG